MKPIVKMTKWQRKQAADNVRNSRALDKAYAVLEGVREQFRGDKYEGSAITNAQDVIAARATRLRARKPR